MELVLVVTSDLTSACPQCHAHVCRDCQTDLGSDPKAKRHICLLRREHFSDLNLKQIRIRIRNTLLIPEGKLFCNRQQLHAQIVWSLMVLIIKMFLTSCHVRHLQAGSKALGCS